MLTVHAFHAVPSTLVDLVTTGLPRHREVPLLTLCTLAVSSIPFRSLPTLIAWIFFTFKHLVPLFPSPARLIPPLGLRSHLQDALPSRHRGVHYHDTRESASA